MNGVSNQNGNDGHKEKKEVACRPHGTATAACRDKVQLQKHKSLQQWKERAPVSSTTLSDYDPFSSNTLNVISYQYHYGQETSVL